MAPILWRTGAPEKVGIKDEEVAEAANARQSILKHSSYHAHRTLAYLIPAIVHLHRRHWPLPPPTGPSVMLGLSSETYPCFSSMQRRYPPPSAGALLCPAPALSEPCTGALPALHLRSYPRIAGAIPLPSPALYLSVGPRSVRECAGVARRGAPAQRERDRALCSAPALSPPSTGALPALCLRSPPRCTRALARAILALSAALHCRSPPRYASTRPCTATALSSAARRRYTLGYAGALCRCRHYSLRFAAPPALFPTLCRHSSPYYPGELPTLRRPRRSPLCCAVALPFPMLSLFLALRRCCRIPSPDSPQPRQLKYLDLGSILYKNL